jgi:hypothetical protein
MLSEMRHKEEEKRMRENGTANSRMLSITSIPFYSLTLFSFISQ